MPDAPRIAVAREDKVATLSLHHPPENRLTRSMVRELGDAVAALEKDADVHAVVVTGAGGRDFSAGLDIEEWGSLSAKDVQEAIQRGFEALWAVEHLTKPTVAAIEGACQSVGAELALACDLRVASESATFRFPEVEQAWMPSHGGTARLPRMIGRPRALELFLTARTVDAREASQVGLVDHLTARGKAFAAALDLARRFSARPRTAVHAIKRALTEGEEKPYRNRFLLESQHSVQLLWTEAYRQAQERARRKAP